MINYWIERDYWIDYWIEREYIPNTENFLKTFENIIFVDECCRFIERLTKDKFSCKHYSRN